MLVTSKTPCGWCGEILSQETDSGLCCQCFYTRKVGTSNNLHYVTVWTKEGSYEAFVYEREFLSVIQKMLRSGAICVAFNYEDRLYLLRSDFSFTVTEASPAYRYNASVWI